MFKNQFVSETCFLLPEDGETAKQYLLQIFNEDIKEVYICAYGFNLDELLEEILKLDSKGIPVHMLVDFVQARGTYTWDKLVAFKSKLNNSDLTLTTAGVNSPNKSAIWHFKTISVIRNNSDPLNWEGSVNFSNSGFEQGNSARLFTSKIWSDAFIQQFKIHKQWAIENAPHKQIDWILKYPVNSQALDFNEETSDILYELEMTKKSLIKYKIISFMLIFAIICQWFVFWSPIRW